MAENSKIEWCHHTFNSWWGCVKVSAGCEHCYAETFSKRTGHNIWGPAKTTERRVFGDKHWAEPLKWNEKATEAGERHRVFCASMADVFEDHPQLVAERQRLFELIDRTPHLDWLLLTKRPENIQRLWPFGWYDDQFTWPNVWIGTSVENQEMANKRIPELLKIPAAVRFLSMEPLLGPVDLGRAFPCGYYCDPDAGGGGHHDHPFWSRVASPIHWVIVGGESGHNARPMHIDWAASLRDQCQTAGVAFLFKQWGEHSSTGARVGKKAAGRLLDGELFNEFPMVIP